MTSIFYKVGIFRPGNGSTMVTNVVLVVLVVVLRGVVVIRFSIY